MPLSLLRAFKHGFVLFISVCFLLAILSAQAQDATPPDPALTESPALIPSPTEDVVAPVTTDAPAQSPEPASPVPSTEVTPIVTDEGAVTPMQEAQPTQESPTQPVEAVPFLPLAYSTNFDAGIPAEMSASDGWNEVSLETGQALQPDASATPVTYKDTFADSAAEARFQLLSGEGQIVLRGYAAGLSSSGVLTLTRDQSAVASATVDLAGKTWPLLRLQIIGTQIQVSVDGALLIEHADSTLMPSGQAGFAAVSGSVLRVDDFAVYGVPQVMNANFSVEAMLEATSESTVEPTSTETPDVQVSVNGSAVMLTWVGNAGQTYTIERQAGLSPLSRTVTGTTFTETLGCGLIVWYRIVGVTTWIPVRTTSCVPTCDPSAIVQRVAVGSNGQYQRAEGSYIGNLPGILVELVWPYVYFPSYTMLTHDNDPAELELEQMYGSDLYRYDINTCTTLKVSVGDDEGETAEPAYGTGLFGDGSKAVFYTSPQSKVVVSGSSGTPSNFYVRDLVTDTTQDFLPFLDTVDFRSRISPDGRFVLTLIGPSQLVPDVTDTNAREDLVLYDRQLQTATTVSVDTSGMATANNGSSGGGEVFQHGGSVYVVFDSIASNVVSNDTNLNCGTSGPCSDVFLRNMTTGTTIKLSLQDIEAQFSSRQTRFADATLVNTTLYTLFLVNQGTSGLYIYELYLRTVDLSNPSMGTTTLVSRASGSGGTPGRVSGGFLSDDARWVFFSSIDSTFVSNDTNNVADVFVRDLATNTTVRVSRSSTGAQLTSASNVYEINNNGSHVILNTADTLILPNPSPSICTYPTFASTCQEMYLVTNPLYPSSEPLPTPTLFGPTATHQAAMTQTAIAECNTAPAIKPITVQADQMTQDGWYKGELSSDGRYVVFSAISPFTNDPYEDALENGDPPDVYRYDTLTCTYVKISVGNEEQETTHFVEKGHPGSMTANGDQIIFLTYTIGNVSEGDLNKAYLRTVSTGQTQRLSPLYTGPLPVPSQYAAVASISKDGRYLALHVPNITTFVPSVANTNGNLDDLVAYDRETQTYYPVSVDVTGTHTLTMFPQGVNGPDHPGRILTDGANVYVVFTSTSEDVVGYQTLGNNIFVRNIITGITTQISLSDEDLPSHDYYTAFDATISDGKLSVLFMRNNSRNVYLRTVPLDNLGIGTTQLITTWNSNNPYYSVMSDNARWVAWASSDASLVPNDTNGQVDVFVKDMVTNEVRRASVDSNGAQLTLLSYIEDISGDGRAILIETSNALVPSDQDTGRCGSGANPCQDFYLVPNPLYVAPAPEPSHTPSATPTATPSATPTDSATATHEAALTQTAIAPFISPTFSPLAAPALVGPANGSTTPSMPELKWQAVAGTMLYEVQIDNEASFASPIDSALTGAERVMRDSMRNQGQYWWRVRGENNSATSAWSGPYSVIVNYALSPAPESVILRSPGGITFRWTDLQTPSLRYRVEVDNDLAFTSIDYQSSLVHPASTTLTNITPGVYYWRVRVINTLGDAIPFQNISTVSNRFTVSEPVPPALKPVTPANGAAIQTSAQPFTLSWNWVTQPPAGSSTFTYEVEVDLSPSFNVGPILIEDLTQMSTNMTMLDGTYYWHVRALNGSGIPGPWSTTFSFSVDTVLPDAPALLTPADNALVTTSRPGFTWSKVPDAVKYSLEIAPTCGGIAAYRVDNLTTLAHTIPASASALQEGTYQVCVIAYDKHGNSSGYSVPRTFTMNRVTAPANGAFIPSTLRPTFRWTAAPGKPGEVVSYKLLIDTEPTFTSPSHYKSPDLAAAAASHTGPLLPQGTYYWKLIRTVNGVDEVPTSSRVLIVGALTAGPALVEPTLNEIVTGTTLLDWNEATGPIGTTVNGYEFVVSKAATFTAPVLSEKINGETSYEFTPPANQNRVLHYWRVRGLWDGLPVTNWTSRTFIVDNVAPAAPVITAPVNNALLNTVRPLIRWTAVPTAINYIIAITDPETNTDIVPETTVTGLTYTPTINLPQKPLMVRLQANEGHNESIPSYAMFTLRLGATPAQNAIVATGKPAFTWAAVPEATAYTLQIDNDPYFDTVNPGGDGTVLRTIDLGNVTSHTLAAALPAQGAYYWRVNPTLPTPDTVDYPAATASRSFYWLLATQLKPVGLFTTADAVGNPSTVLFNVDVTSIVFQWTALSTTPPPLRYELQVSTASTFPSLGTQQYSSAVPVLSVDKADFVDGLKYWRVRGIYSADGSSFGAWSTPAQFTLDRVAPLPPLLSIPVISTSSVRPLFGWFAQPQATRYKLTVSDQNGPVQLQPGLDAVIVNGTSYLSPIALDQNNTTGYLWTVQSIDAAGNISGPGQEGRLYIFSGISPTKGQLLTTPRPTFTWIGVPGPRAGLWVVEIATDPEMSHMVYQSGDLPAATVSHLLPAANTLTPGLYFWRVYRVNENKIPIQGQPFYVGAAASITPRLSAPAPSGWINAEQLAVGAEFRWEAQLAGSPAINATPLVYHFQLAKSPTFAANTIVLSREDVAGVTFNLNSGMLPASFTDGIYYWRVRAHFPAGLLGPYSATFAVRIDQVAPTKPALLAPVTGDVVTNTYSPVLSWTASAGAAQYIIEVSTDETFSPLYRTQTVASTIRSLTLSNVPNGVYYWRVLAVDAANNQIPSISRGFTIAAP